MRLRMLEAWLGLALANRTSRNLHPTSDGECSGCNVYRNGFMKKASKKDLWVDGKYLGEIETEPEFSPNFLEVFMEADRNYFMRQFIKTGAFVGGTGLEQISEEQGKVDRAKLGSAQPGDMWQPSRLSRG